MVVGNNNPTINLIGRNRLVLDNEQSQIRVDVRWLSDDVILYTRH
jgi:hypothetical protein